MAKEKIAKTNATRLLDKDKIKYELVPYEVDENDLSCVHVAATLGENIEQVFKTLVLHGDKSGYFVCENGCEGFGKQEMRPYSRQGTASVDRVYSGRMFSNRHEKTFSYVYSSYMQ